MSDLTQAYLILTPDLERVFADADVDLNDLIRRAAPDVRIEMGENPAAKVAGQKEVVTILIASAAVIGALTPVLKELIRAATNRPVVATELTPVPLLDREGKPILRPNGEPAVEWARTMRDLNPALGLSIKGLGIEFSIGRQ